VLNAGYGSGILRLPPDILNHVVSGRLIKEIASDSRITVRTVKEHRGRVMEKMGANSLAELVTMIVTARLHETRMTA